MLVYFLRAPLAGYLTGRIGKVREDLVTAGADARDRRRGSSPRSTRSSTALPAELEALKQRGAEDIVAERARIEQDGAGRAPARCSSTPGARSTCACASRSASCSSSPPNLAVDVASERIKTSITADDQARLIDRYASQLHAGEVRQ